MGMNLDQAIKKYERDAENYDRVNFSERAAEKRQLVKWLKELKNYREVHEIADKEWQEMLREVRARG